MSKPNYSHNKKERRNKRRLNLITLLGGKCANCGSKKDLHFDHQDPGKKSNRIANLIDAPEDILMAEVNKCILLCSKCHREKTREKGEHGQPKARHGTIWMYKKECRCPECKAAMSEYGKRRRLEKLKEIAKDI